MNDKVGRNDLCPCGSGKKYKNCHMLSKEPPTPPKRTFTAKVISSGSVQKPAPVESLEHKAAVDYNTLMDRAFGEAIHSKEEKPPVPPDPSIYLPQDNEV